MTIPKEFQLMGQTIKVKVVNETHEMLDGNRWMAYFLDNTIYLRSKLPNTLLTQTLLHEVTHFILRTMWRDELNDDEEFVETFSWLMHQFLATKKP